MKIAVYDYETTGLDTESCEVVGFAAILYNTENNDTLEFRSFRKAEGGVPEGAMSIHGITEEMVKQFPVYNKESFGLQLLKTVKVIAGYNHLNYDNKITTRLGFNTYSRKNLDVFLLLKKYKVDLGLSKVGKLSEMYNFITGKEPQNAHDALSDCKMTLEILLVLNEKFNVFNDLKEEMLIDKENDEKQTDFVLTMGKYVGRMFSEVVKNDKPYALWVQANVKQFEGTYKEKVMKQLLT